MSFVMVAAALYGVLQLALLASPVRSLRLSTVLLTVAVGAYGSGVVAALIELGYAHSAASHAGQPLREAMGQGAYTVVPIVEELAKLAPLLLAGLNLKIRYQLGLADYVVLGSATGAGLGLFEVLLSHLLDAQRASPLPDGGWMLSGGLGLGGSTYIPDWSTVLTTWLPASLGSLDMSFTEATLGTSLHLAWGAVGALGAGLLLRGLGWRRLLGLLPIAYAIGHHTLVNYSGQRDSHPSDWADSLLNAADDMVGYTPLICLVIAMIADYRQLRRSKLAMPGVLLDSERTGRTGMTALTGFATWCVPWTVLIALRFARLRRALLYAAGRTHPEKLEALHQAVADTAPRMDAANHDSAWDSSRIRALFKADRPKRPWRRRWPLLVISLLLMLPSMIFLGVGSFTATKDLQKHFTAGNGPRLVMWFGVAAVAWTLVQLVFLLRAWRTTARQPLAEPQAVLRLRVFTALGSALAGTLLLTSHYRGRSLDGEVVDPLAMLLAALENLELYAGIALTILSLAALIMLFPPGGLALAGGGVLAGAATVEAAQAAALGGAGIALMAQGSQSSGGNESPAKPGGAKRADVPQWLRDKWNKGNQFNKDNWHRYPANEITLENGKRLDSYRHGKEIVSRKETQISKISENTFKGYVREIAQKYKEGTRIPDTAKARKEYPNLIGKPLKGKYYLEVPVQSKPVPKWALQDAANNGVIIRDVKGFIYRLPKG